MARPVQRVTSTIEKPAAPPRVGAGAEETRRAIRDVVSLAALPAMWMGAEPERIGESLLAALDATLRPSFSYLRLHLGERGAAPIEILHVQGARVIEVPESLGDELVERATSRGPDDVWVLAHPGLGQPARVCLHELGADASTGVLAAGFACADAPSETERLLLKLGANQVLVACKNAALIREREQAEERFRRLADLLPVAVYTCDARDGRITYFNQRAVEAWGRAPDLGDDGERFCGSARMIRPDGTPLPHEDCPMAIALRDGAAFRNEEVIVERPDGSRITALVNIDPVRDAAGKVVEATNVFLDVSKLKQAEQALRDADRRKDQFLATLAHELRNPLASIRSAVDVLKGAADDADALSRARDVVDRQSEQLARLVDDLLDVSRITRDRLELRKRQVSLRAILERAIETSLPAADRQTRRIDVRLPPRDVLLHGDAVRLAQVFGNLLHNACKYTPHGGGVRLHAEVRGGEAIVTVEDDGIGIPPDQLDAIFDMFVQVDLSLGRSRGGLGIGLTLVKRLVAMHGGSVSAASDGSGRGSRFEVRLPIAPALGDPAETRPSAAPAPVPNRRVLVVDDNHDAADLLALSLSRSGHEVRVAYDGEQALETAEAFRPDLVLLDIGMPRLDGIEVCRRIRARDWGAKTCVVALSGWGQEKDRRETRAAGFDEHLIKPVDAPALRSVLGDLPRSQDDNRLMG